MRSAALERERCSLLLTRPIRLVNPTERASPSTELPACSGRFVLGTEVDIEGFSSDPALCAGFSPLLANVSDSMLPCRPFMESLLLWSTVSGRSGFTTVDGSPGVSHLLLPETDSNCPQCPTVHTTQNTHVQVTTKEKK